MLVMFLAGCGTRMRVISWFAVSKEEEEEAEEEKYQGVLANVVNLP